MALKQSFSQKLEQKLSPQQIQLMKLLQVPTMELDQRIKQELEVNPALEEGKEEVEDEFEQEEYKEEAGEDERDFDIDEYLTDDEPAYKTNVVNKGKDDEDKSMPLSSGKTFQERMLSQLNMQRLTEEEVLIATYLIGSLDDAGYLERDLESIVDDLAFSQNIMTTEKELENVLNYVQELDPPGVGARDLQECLILQMERRQDGDITRYTALKILEDYFEEFTKKHYKKIIAKMEISEEDLKDAVHEIIRLNPKPGGSLKSASKSLQQVVPDFQVIEEDGKLSLTLNGRNAPDLKINRGYKNMLKNYSEGAKLKKSDKEALTFVKSKLDAAKWFIDAIQQRQNTLFSTMTAIMNYQKDYFLTGDDTKLRPMILKDIAEIVDLDISTISRVANSKYVQTQYGTFSLKHFFSESLSTDSGEEVSTREVKQILLEAVEEESKRKPLTDEKLASLLKGKGYNIARRTVAKYREQLNIPVARLRKEL
ncbi:RNA polymerase factor sigma-54 [Brumimicrobium aurantiacum]|uniref:RNA polymerase sigma-54 factor n=1 Tax=Brumimicrobium aurantiacum TaxID=1737063 RepID=A0A3E1EVJ1_9FLAO|nr:RNA polymerase factor sigma-54 [Brumimicrobium aurantiacum]RFC53575.1 RNA polymerase sigma-54 factor [Brumimicrobium aurantiacum]